MFRIVRTTATILLILSLASCGENGAPEGAQTPAGAVQAQGTPAPAPRASPPEAREDARWAPLRHRMVEGQLDARDVHDPRVLDAMRAVPRHLFVPEPYRDRAYSDHPLPIGFEQTISQPYIVGLMSQLAAVGPPCKVLEVGTGSGYQAAVLAQMGCDVFSIEIVEPLARRSGELLRRMGYARVRVRAGDGYRGWPEHAPFDAIVITAAPPRIPEPLKGQLAVGGRMVVPVGESYQELIVLTRTERGFDRRTSIPVRFVPMTGEVQEGP